MASISIILLLFKKFFGYFLNFLINRHVYLFLKVIIINNNNYSNQNNVSV